MPVIEGADMTTISTKRQALPEGDYRLQITTSEFDESKTKIIIKTKVVESSVEGQVGKEFWDWCSVVGEWKEIGLQQIKRYLEAVFGKGSPEAEAVPPDTDVLHGHVVDVYLAVESYKGKSGEEEQSNRAKRIRAAA